MRDFLVGVLCTLMVVAFLTGRGCSCDSDAKESHQTSSSQLVPKKRERVFVTPTGMKVPESEFSNPYR